MGALNLDRFSEDTDGQINVSSRKVKTACAIPHPSSIMRIIDLKERTHAVLGAITTIRQMLPDFAFDLGRAERMVTLEELYRAFVRGQEIFEVQEQRRTLPYDDLENVSTPKRQLDAKGKLTMLRIAQRAKRLLREDDVDADEFTSGEPGVQSWLHEQCGARTSRFDPFERLEDRVRLTSMPLAQSCLPRSRRSETHGSTNDLKGCSSPSATT